MKAQWVPYEKHTINVRGYCYLDQQNSSDDVPMCPENSKFFLCIILCKLHKNICENDIITSILQIKLSSFRSIELAESVLTPLSLPQQTP